MDASVIAVHHSQCQYSKCITFDIKAFVDEYSIQHDTPATKNSNVNVNVLVSQTQRRNQCAKKENYTILKMVEIDGAVVGVTYSCIRTNGYQH